MYKSIYQSPLVEIDDQYMTNSKKDDTLSISGYDYMRSQSMYSCKIDSTNNLR